MILQRSDLARADNFELLPNNRTQKVSLFGSLGYRVEMKIPSFFRLSSLFVLNLILIGCASEQLILPESEMTPFTAASERNPVRTQLKMAVNKVVDQRNGDPHQLGWTDTGLRSQTPVLLERTVADTFGYELKKELAARGVKMSQSADLNIDVEILKFDLATAKSGAFHTPSCESEMQFNLDRPAAKRRATVNVKSSFQAPAPVFKMQLSNAQTVASCLNLAVETLIKNDDFLRIINE